MESNNRAFTRARVLENRRTWVNFLKNKKLRKAKEKLDAGDGSRCCLGHGCYILKIKRRKGEYKYIADTSYFVYGEEKAEGLPPREFVNMVGLWKEDGSPKHLGVSLSTLPFRGIGSLADLNDETAARPWQIGEYLETVIEGGETTPFRPLSDYLE